MRIHNPIKHCQHCKKTEGNFTIMNTSKNGFIGYMCRECNTERCKEYRKTIIGSENIRRAVYKSIRKYHKKQLARAKLNYHVRMGNIIKPSTCENCKKERKLEGHHEDYRKPLRVKWLCKDCHVNV